VDGGHASEFMLGVLSALKAAKGERLRCRAGACWPTGAAARLAQLRAPQPSRRCPSQVSAPP
jgi:hypothetical protein